MQMAVRTAAGTVGTKPIVIVKSFKKKKKMTLLQATVPFLEVTGSQLSYRVGCG